MGSPRLHHHLCAIDEEIFSSGARKLALRSFFALTRDGGSFFLDLKKSLLSIEINQTICYDKMDWCVGELHAII